MRWNIVKPPRAPRGAAFNSRSQSRAMLDCVERKNTSTQKKIPRCLIKFSRRAPLFEYFFCTARFARRLFTQILQQLSETWEDRCIHQRRRSFFCTHRLATYIKERGAVAPSGQALDARTETSEPDPYGIVIKVKVHLKRKMCEIRALGNPGCAGRFL